MDIRPFVSLFVMFSIVILVGGSILWLLRNPAILVLAIAGVGGIVYGVARFRAARNRV